MGVDMKSTLESTPLPIVFATAALAVLVWLATRWAFARRTSKEKLTKPPGPEPWPIAGNLFSLAPHPHRALADLAHSYGDILSVQIGGKATVVISSPEIAKEIVSKKANLFSRRLDPLPMAVDLLLAGGNHSKNRSIPGISFSLIEPKLRKIITNHLLTPKLVAASAPFREDEVRALCQAVHEEVEENLEKVQPAERSGEMLRVGRLENLRMHVRRAVLNMWLQMSFGSRILEEIELTKALSEEPPQGHKQKGSRRNEQISGLLQQIGQQSATKKELTDHDRQTLRQYVLLSFEATEEQICNALGTFMLADHILLLRSFCKDFIRTCKELALRRDHALEALVEGARVDLSKKPPLKLSKPSASDEDDQWEVVPKSDEKPAKKGAAKPPLAPSRAVNASEKTKPPLPSFTDILLSLDGSEKLTDAGICALLYDLIHSAVGPISAAVEWTMAELVKNPKVQAELRRELDWAVGMSGPFTEADLGKTPFLQAVVLESLRLHPPVPMLPPRQVTKECRIDNYTLSPGNYVQVNAWAIARDPRHWSNSWSFDPSRFKRQDQAPWKRLNDFKMLPFGVTGLESGCPSGQLGLKIVGLIVAELVRGFQWSAVETDDRKLEKMMEEGHGVEVMEMRRPLVASVLIREA